MPYMFLWVFQSTSLTFSYLNGVQLMGLVAQLKTRKARSAQPLLDTAALLADLPDDAIIEL